MFGTFRLLLSTLVVLGHLAPYELISTRDFHFGICAVFLFFLLSGYVMTCFYKSLSLGKNPVWDFYVDRFLRIYPPYLFFLLLVLITNIIFKQSLYFSMGEVSNSLDENVSGPLTVKTLLYNILLVPMNYAPFDLELSKVSLIPPAWSLGAEVQFYLCLPFLVANKLFRKIAWFLSVIIFVLGALNFLDSDKFAFVYFPGVFFVFIFGMGLSEIKNESTVAVTKTPTYLLLFFLTLVLIGANRFFQSHKPEVLLGVLLGSLIVHKLGQYPRKRWDEVLGTVAYGVFLGHSLLVWLFNSFGLLETRLLLRSVVIVLASYVFGFLGYALVEKPFRELRSLYRKRSPESKAENLVIS